MEQERLVEKVVEIKKQDRSSPLQCKALRVFRSLIPVLRVGGSSPFRRASKKVVKPLVFLWFHGFFATSFQMLKNRFFPFLSFRVVEKVVELLRG